MCNLHQNCIRVSTNLLENVNQAAVLLQYMVFHLNFIGRLVRLSPADVWNETNFSVTANDYGANEFS